METRYYSGGGPSGSEHKLALHASKRVFDRIKGHLDRKERIQEETRKELEHKEYLRNATKAMTESWDNSIENLRKKKEEARIQRMTQKADDRVEQYYKVLKWQAEERKLYNDAVAKRILITRGPQKDLNSSVLYSDCLHANAKHIELKNQEKEEEHRSWREAEQKIIEQDEEFKKNEIVKRCKRKVLAQKNQEFLKQQQAEKQRQIEEERKNRLESEKSDILRQKEEMRIIKQNKEEDFLNAKKYQTEALKRSRDIQARKRQASAKRDKEVETVCTIYRDTKTKITCKGREVTKKEIQRIVDCQVAACKNLELIQEQKLAEEEQRIARAIAEKDKVDDMKKNKRRAYEEKLLKERKEGYENIVRETEKKREIVYEMKKWDTLNRLKTMEVLKKEDEETEKKRLEKMKKFSEMLDEQVEQKNQRRAEQKAKEELFRYNDFPEADERFLKYSEQMLAKQKAAGKPTYPVEYAIMKYKRQYGLVPRKLQRPFASSGDENNHKNFKSPTVCPVKSDPTATKNCFCT